jgi:hypothetical protein
MMIEAGLATSRNQRRDEHHGEKEVLDHFGYMRTIDTQATEVRAIQHG